ncbi:hypothetical protein SKAU_G00345760 [Synaphobranchus kaupii]|uniref:Adenine phosphoribosyltransferase n=1 Tax=Synaphobranchus kaupii TaxID=118154 RepID=A0A9Q1IFJ0_SYNKA|nr:hypothetical protein SKAU_G00345760 [Synaphobranchus kaupii]
MATRYEKREAGINRSEIRAFTDFPSKGIVFRDICPILKDPEALAAIIDLFEERVRETCPGVELVVGLDARGFLFGPLLAQRLRVGFVLVRKKGKLPGPTASVAYTLEYGQAEAEIQEDAVEAGQKVVIIDDLLATGGTLYATCELMKKQKAKVLGCLVVIELKDLKGAGPNRTRVRVLPWSSTEGPLAPGGCSAFRSIPLRSWEHSFIPDVPAILNTFSTTTLRSTFLSSFR